MIGFAGAPWTVATYMIEGQGGTDFVAAKRMSHERPDPVPPADRYSGGGDHWLSDRSDRYRRRAAADLRQLGRGAADDSDFAVWSIAPTRAIVTAVKSARPGVPIIGFPRGAGAQYLAYAQETGVDAVSLDFGVPLDWAASALPKRIALQGNLDPALLLVGGAPLDAAIDRIRRAIKDRPFIFNLGHGVMPATPPEHVARLVERVRAKS